MNNLSDYNRYRKSILYKAVSYKEYKKIIKETVDAIMNPQPPKEGEMVIIWEDMGANGIDR